jgi:hypothetical protein
VTRPRIAIFLIALFVFLAEAHATDINPLQARDILYVAYGQYHGPRELIEYPPKINVVSADALRERFRCAARCQPIMGLYDEESGEIYLLETLDFSKVYATTVLLHEYIHYFQGKIHGKVKDLKLSGNELCLEIVEREREAYRIQYEVLIKAGDFMHAQSVRMVAGMVHC